ncbi:DinB family protein [Bacillus sp. RG28]|uniref:DinB family protein n=1 Tax=Gottfriedia endophytica TaxID=2820819 RepID=A0A940NXI6_9BACI|nr:DinB family protein [Gottfriedia endophytica]MBP0726853.1 DinB family protein [Gottfriedia endophytica]
MNRNEYDWVRQTRGVLLDFCSELEPNDFTRQNGFAWQSVRDSLVHIADCYYAWLGSFVLLKTTKPITPKEELDHFNLEKIKIRFEQVDSFVAEVFERYGNQLNEQIERNIPWRAAPEMMSITPGKLLTHTITHEFHHKGQIVAMLRQMGYEPPNTDVLGTDD